jgi:translation initiation factor IF-3
LNNKTRINGEIRYEAVRVIGEGGEQLGVMSSRDAQKLAIDAGVDLVEITASANPPVVKIIDWGKFQYQKMKELSKAKKKSKSSELKQIRLGLKIGDNDLNIKLKKVREFLDDGDRVKITVIFRGREMAHREVGEALMARIIELIADVAVVDQKPQMAGRNLSISVHRK